MSTVFYVQDSGSKEIDFDEVFRFYRKICFICPTSEQLERTKRQFLEWLGTHDFSIDYSFNLFDDIHRGECTWIFQH